jgi:hypothetical protein
VDDLQQGSSKVTGATAPVGDLEKRAAHSGQGEVGIVVVVVVVVGVVVVVVVGVVVVVVGVVVVVVVGGTVAGVVVPVGPLTGGDVGDDEGDCADLRFELAAVVSSLRKGRTGVAGGG